jgi:site-specific DNA recombinase
MDRYALYLRTSTETQEKKVTIALQRESLKHYVNFHGLSVYKFYEDDGVSSGIMLSDRPAGAKMLADAKQGLFAHILVHCLDRLGRGLFDLLSTQRALTKLNVMLKSVTEDIDFTTPDGVLKFHIHGVIAENEKSKIVDRLARGRALAARQGRWMNGPIPLGYDLSDEGCLLPSEKLIAGMTEADLARNIFENIANGSTTVEECTRLDRLGIHPFSRYGGNVKVLSKHGEWWPSRINNMVRSTVYYGTHVLKSKYGNIEREVPALITRDLWEKANAQIERNKTLPKNPKAQRRTYLLRGLITCTCGFRYVGGPRHDNRSNTVRYWYRCGSQANTVHRKRTGRCPAKVLKADLIVELVWSDCLRFIENPDLLLNAAKQQLHARMAETAKMDGKRQQLQKALHEKDAQKQKLLEAYSLFVATSA